LRRYRIAIRSFSAFTNTKNAWPSSSIRATASSSNIGSMSNRFTFTIWPRLSSASVAPAPSPFSRSEPLPAPRPGVRSFWR